MLSGGGDGGGSSGDGEDEAGARWRRQGTRKAGIGSEFHILLLCRLERQPCLALTAHNHSSHPRIDDCLTFHSSGICYLRC